MPPPPGSFCLAKGPGCIDLRLSAFDETRKKTEMACDPCHQKKINNLIWRFRLYTSNENNNHKLNTNICGIYTSNKHNKKFKYIF